MRYSMSLLFACGGLTLAALGGPASAEVAEIKSDNLRRPIVPWTVSAPSEPARAASASGAPGASTAYHWAAFTASLGEADLARLEAVGVEILGFAGRPGGYRVYKVRVGGAVATALAALRDMDTFVNLLEVLPEEKVPRKVLKGEFRSRRPSGRVQATLWFHRPLGKARIEALLKGKVDEVLPGEGAGSVHVVATPQRVQALKDLDEVARVEDFQEPLPLMDRARVQTKVGAVQYGVLDTTSFPPTPAWNAGLPFTGDSIWISVTEAVDEDHLDFREAVPGGTVRRGVNGAPWSPWPGGSGHGTFVAGVALGNGWNSEYNGYGRYRIRGVAPKALLTGGSHDGDVGNTSTGVSTKGHYSYGDWDIDNRLSRHVSTTATHNNVEVWPAGNNGLGAENPSSYGMQRGHYSMLLASKNAIKVAGTMPDGTHMRGSGTGPMRDGRLGPDIAAPAIQIMSVTAGGQGYHYNNGTSFASPHVAGIVALMLQKYRDQVLVPRGAGANIHDHPLWNSSVRAILVHTADDMSDLSGVGEANPDYAANGYPNTATLYGTGPDFATGYGRVNAQKALQFTAPGYFREGSIGQGQVLSYNITVPAGQSRLRVTLAWDDPPSLAIDSATAYDIKLVNDLDLRLVSPNGQTYLVYAPDYSHLHNGTIPANGIDPITPLDVTSSSPPLRDEVSNLEVKDVVNPEAGTWRIEVHGQDIVLDQSVERGVNQDFSVVSDFTLPAAPSASGPDLVVTRLVTLPSRPVVGEDIHLVATVHNRGTQATPAIGHAVGFYAGGVSIDVNANSVQSLAPGASVVVPTRVPYVLPEASRSVYDFAAVADAPDLFAEASEQNNARSLAHLHTTMPTPWVSGDIGQPNGRGNSYFWGQGKFRVEGSGGNLEGTSDNFHFLHRPLSGDGEIRARFESLFAHVPDSKVGLMVRESDAPGARFVMLAFNEAGHNACLWRTTAGGPVASTSVSAWPLPYARLVRAGNIFTAYVSSDGVVWTQVLQISIPLPSQARIGIAAAGEGTWGTGATLAQVAVSGGVGATLSGKVSNATGVGVSGVSVSVSGCGTTFGAVTDAAGRYSFSGLQMGGTCVVRAVPGAYVLYPYSQSFPAWDSDREADFLAVPASLPSPWATANVGVTGSTGMAGQNAGQFTLAGGGADIFGTADGFRYAYRSLSGDGEIRARVDRLSAVDPFAKAGVMFREGTAADARNVFMGLTNTQGATFQSRSAAGGTTVSNRIVGFAAPYWVRIVRIGNVFTGYRSTNGVSWTQHGQVTLALPATLNLGLAVTSHNTGATANANFSAVTVSSLAFTEADIGAPALAGNRTVSGDAQTVRGSGADIWGTSDAFHFSHLPLAGDGEIRARVASVQNTDTWAKAGLMIRETLAANSRNVLVAVTPSQGVTFQRRLLAGGGTVNTVQTGQTAPQWLRLVRAGNLFSAYRSANGTAWTLIGQETLSLPANVYVGLAVTSHNNGALAAAVFEQVMR